MKSRRAIRSELLELICHDQISVETRALKLRSIYQHMLANSRSIRTGNFRSISNCDLGLLFQITDEQFFGGQVGRLCEKTAARPLSFRLSTRMTRVGGTTTMQAYNVSRRHGPEEVDFEITIATTPLFNSFQGPNESAEVSGLICTDRMEALQRIMEHEMVHLIEMLLWDDSNCSASRFKNIVGRFFGHTQSHHQLLTPTDVAKQKLGISAGDLVWFVHEGQRVQGHVNRITKRATVLVRSQRGQLYNDGYKYQKFYVPLNRLKRVA